MAFDLGAQGEPVETAERTQYLILTISTNIALTLLCLTVITNASSCHSTAGFCLKRLNADASAPDGSRAKDLQWTLEYFFVLNCFCIVLNHILFLKLHSFQHNQIHVSRAVNVAVRDGISLLL